MKKLLLSLGCVALAGCFATSPEPAPTPEAEPAFQTYSATFQGTLYPSTNADFQLVTDTGRILYVTSQEDYASYLQTAVELSGTVTGEQDSIISLTATSLTSLETEPVASSSSSESLPETGSAAVVDEPEANTEDPTASDDAVEQESEVAPAEEQNETPETSTINKAEAIATMLEEDISAEFWTFTYCTHHFEGFCVAVHKNWWYKAFGTTSDSLFHIEIGTSELTELGDGVINVDLVTKEDAEKIGEPFPRVDWGNDYVFVVSGPMELTDIMQFIADSITQG